MMNQQLSLSEAHRLEVLESVIDAGLQTFVHVGNALLEIRDSRLYRQTHGTFEEYCREKLGFNSSRARQLIDAAQVVANIQSVTVVTLPDSETHVRPLVYLPPEAQREVWQVAVETAPGGKVTAAHVQGVVKQYRNAAANVGDADEHVEMAMKSPALMMADDEPIRQSIPHVANNSGNNEWYTPAEYIEAARAVMGRIDLDPASSSLANTVVGATRFYSVSDNGLQQDWAGKVWLNPPYAGDLIGKFTAKLALHVSNRDVAEAIVLVNNATETAWFADIVRFSSAIVFPRARVKFWQENGVLGAPLQGQAILYIGVQVDSFLAVFCKFGWGGACSVNNWRLGSLAKV